MLDLTNLFTLGDITGSPAVWVALKFASDGSVNYADGAHVDNIVLRKYVSGAAGAAPEGTLIEPAGDGLIEVPSSEEFSIQ